MAPNTRSSSKPVASTKVETDAVTKSTPTKKPTKKLKNPKYYQYVLADVIACLIWAFVSSLFLEVSLHIQEQLQKLQFEIDELHLVVALIVVGLGVLGPLITFGIGVSPMLNPAVTSAFMVAEGNYGLNLLRIFGQFVGHGLGVLAAVSLIPVSSQSGFVYLSGKVKAGMSWYLGFAVEAWLVFIIAIASLYSIEQGKREGDRAKRQANIINWIGLLSPHFLTILVCFVGSLVTGPSLNPFLAFFWNSFAPSHSWEEHVVVFWAGPFVGSTLAALLWSSVTKNDAKQKRISRGAKDSKTL